MKSTRKATKHKGICIIAFMYFAVVFMSCAPAGSYDGRIRFTTFQDATTVIGQPDMTSSSANTGGSVAANTLLSPWGNPIVINGRLYICDFGNNRVLGYNAVPGTDFAGADFVMGQTDMTSNSPNQDGTASETSMQGPSYIHTNGVQFAVADCLNNRVLLYNFIPALTNVSADLVVGQPDFASTSEGTELNRMKWPTAVFLLPNKLIVVECMGHRVLIFNTIPSENNASADIVLGTGSQGLSETQFDYPCDVWSDGNKLVVADSMNNRILIWNTFPTASNKVPDEVLGQSNFTTNTGGVNAAKYSDPYLMHISDLGQFFICDYNNNRILIWNSFPEFYYTPADAVLGQPDFTTNTPGASANKMYHPSGVFLYQNKLFTLEYDNHRMLVFTGSYF